MTKPTVRITMDHSPAHYGWLLNGKDNIDVRLHLEFSEPIILPLGKLCAQFVSDSHRPKKFWSISLGADALDDIDPDIVDQIPSDVLHDFRHCTSAFITPPLPWFDENVDMAESDLIFIRQLLPRLHERRAEIDEKIAYYESWVAEADAEVDAEEVAQ